MGIFSKGDVGGRQGGDSPKGSKPKRVVVRKGRTAGKGVSQNKKKVGGQGKNKGGKGGGKGGAAAGLDRWG
jgi:hypothetical protein